jgi:uncharacterized protein
VWDWDVPKAIANKRKHGVSFEAAQDVFEDPFHISLLDPCEGEERWRTLGQPFLELPKILLVVHTLPTDEWERGRIVSTREATKAERKIYEEAKWRTGFK